MAGTARGSVVPGGTTAVRADEDHWLVVPRRFIATHTRGIGGHAGQREANGVGAFGEKALDRLDGDVTFDQVAVDLGGVTRGDLVIDAVRGAVRGPIRVVDDRDRCSVCAQVHDPRCTATSTRVTADVEHDITQLDTVSALGDRAGGYLIDGCVAGDG